MFIGGSSEAAARRAGLRGDGFFPYVISPEELAARLETVRETAAASGRDLPDDFSVTVWPWSYDNAGTFDLELAKAYRDVGVERFVVAAFESGGGTIEEIHRFVGEYQDRILGQL